MPVESGADWGAVILAGGTGERLGGADKASLSYGGRTLLERALEAVSEASEVVVLGREVPVERKVTFTLETPAGGGPAAGFLAGLAALTTRPPMVAVLAVDMPRVTQGTFRRLLRAARGHDGAILTAAGRPQLAGVVSAAAIRKADPGPGARDGLSVRALTAGLDLAPVAAIGPEGLDIDTWSDLRP